jgi:hypothetical protein
VLRVKGGTRNMGAVDVSAAMTADVQEIAVVVAHQERATLPVGDTFAKIDADRARTDGRSRR